jgi:malate dehydrogenase (oxaloacetate-decarboxylating)(NADP+)
LDLGTDTQKFLDDPFYLGMREHRPTEPVMTAFMDEFMEEITKICPKLLVQFEVCFLLIFCWLSLLTLSLGF